jgi:ABC-type bacteriocin/lantibiotic exporter with double-glycine peptidase domain
VDNYQDNQKALSNFSLSITMAEMFIPIFTVMFAAFYTKGTYGTVGQILFIYIIIGYFVRYSTSFANAFTQLYLLKSSLFYINDLLDEQEVERDGEEEVYSFESLELTDLFFRYNDNQKYILNHLNMKVEKGQKVSIVGLSGTGKTTIIKLIANLYRPTQGSIMINGNKELNQINDKLYGQMLGIVMQQPIVFNRTIRENLVMDAANVSEANIEQALRSVNLWEDVNVMPMKLNTVISGQGGNLSGGQIQRLTIARALIMKPQVLLLDEATSSVDVENEKLIFSNLKKLSITLIVISHRLSTVADSDRIYVLKDGTFVESGKQETLITTEGLYANLYKSSLQ